MMCPRSQNEESFRDCSNNSGHRFCSFVLFHALVSSCNVYLPDVNLMVSCFRNGLFSRWSLHRSVSSSATHVDCLEWGSWQWMIRGGMRCAVYPTGSSVGSYPLHPKNQYLLKCKNVCWIGSRQPLNQPRTPSKRVLRWLPQPQRYFFHISMWCGTLGAPPTFLPKHFLSPVIGWACAATQRKFQTPPLLLGAAPVIYSNLSCRWILPCSSSVKNLFSCSDRLVALQSEN